LDPHQIEAVAAEYPAHLLQRLGADAPPILTALGNLDLLALPKTALFCSARCPGNVILHASVGGHLENLTRRLRAWGIPFGFL